MNEMSEEERRTMIKYEQYQKQKMKKEKKIRGVFYIITYY